MSRSRFPWILAGILLFSFAAWGLTGLVLAAAGSAAAYGASLRLHPRRWGAGQWGAPHIRAENTRGRQARAKARQERTTR